MNRLDGMLMLPDFMKMVDVTRFYEINGADPL